MEAPNAPTPLRSKDVEEEEERSGQQQQENNESAGEAVLPDANIVGM